MGYLSSLKLKLNNWRHERIPEIERPACPNCKRTMYWHRGKQDWTCESCDNYYWHMDHGFDDHDDYDYDGHNEDEHYQDPEEWAEHDSAFPEI